MARARGREDSRLDEELHDVFGWAVDCGEGGGVVPSANHDLFNETENTPNGSSLGRIQEVKKFLRTLLLSGLC